jgi:hypothetical protein
VIALPGLQQRILSLLKEKPGMTDRQIADELLGRDKHQSPVNIACRALEKKGLNVRKTGEDGRIRNYLTGNVPPPPDEEEVIDEGEFLSEDQIKKMLEIELKKTGWNVDMADGGLHGIDVDAHRGKERWIIKVKGPGTRNEMRINDFIGILGELLHKMNDPNARYSIALPDLEQFRRLWKKLPGLAKERTGISIVYINKEGKIQEEK